MLMRRVKIVEVARPALSPDLEWIRILEWLIATVKAVSLRVGTLQEQGYMHNRKPKVLCTSTENGLCEQHRQSEVEETGLMAYCETCIFEALL